MDSMIKGYAAQLVLTHFDAALVGVVAAYAVVYIFAGPHRFYQRIPQATLAVLVAYGGSRLARVGIHHVTRLLQRLLANGHSAAHNDGDGSNNNNSNKRSTASTTTAAPGRDGAVCSSSRKATTVAPVVDATATD